jgi:hypothetical protein
MSKLYSSHKRFIGIGLMSALVIALAALAALLGFSQSASAQGGLVTLVHVEPSGVDYTGNPYCPDTDWSDGKNAPVVNPWHDCNNITSQNHVIRTSGWDPGFVPPIEDDWNVENFSGANATIIAQGRCGDIAEVIGRTGWDTANDDEVCLVIHSSTPGETRVTLTYDDSQIGTIYTTNPVVKEWDSLTDSVILKYGDLEKVKVYYDADGDTVVGTSEYKELYLPLDVNNDGVRDTDDEHELDKQSTWQDHEVVWDESLKRIKVPVPLEITEVVHGEHQVLIDSVSVTTHQPTEGALVEAVIESERNCTYFTDSTGAANYGDTIDTTSDNLGRVVVYLDTVCEEQVVVHFYAQYPNLPGSLRLGLHEWIGINWTTIELAKQPLIRWAGEQIVLEKRWALPDEYYPNVDEDGYLLPICPNWGMVAQYNREDPSPGGLETGLWDLRGPLANSPDAVSTLVDWECISGALYESEDPGEVNVKTILSEVLPGLVPLRETYLATMNDAIADFNSGEITQECLDGILVDTQLAWQADLQAQATAPIVSLEINKHAFLVWYIKIYQVKLTNVDGERDYHNAGDWTFGDGDDTEGDTLNVSADTLLRVKVKGWLFTEDNSGRGAVCVDMDGDGDGDDETTDDEPGVPYQLPMYETGCPDPDDQIVDHGHWVLPDDLEALAGPNAILTRPNWDVMSEPEDSSTTAVGPKSALDTHDTVLRPWLLDKTVVPDGAITEADAIMPPLKIRAEIADGDAGFLKEALKGVDVYGSTNDYHSIMIPANSAIPAIVNNGGYDWMSYDLPACSDADMDGVCDADDLCPINFDPTNSDIDNDDVGDVCDDDADGDGILDDGDDSGVIGDNPCVYGDTTDCDDNCRLVSNADQADDDSDGVGTLCDVDDDDDTETGVDSDGDTILDGADNCPADSNSTQTDSDGDGYGDACDAYPNLAYWLTAPIPYPFWTIINKFGAEGSDVPTPYYIEIYTDNRGEGMFFANGDYDLSFDDCREDPVSGAPDCSPGDVVGESNITVIGDYPYFRKHAAVLSNPVVKTWEWGGFKTVTAENIDANHTAIIAHLKDRDGYCKYNVKSDPTAAKGVTTSPSLNPVQGEEIEFILNTEVGSIIDVSPNGLYNPPAPHDPLTDASVTGLEDGTMINRSEAVALAEDERVLDYYEEAYGVVEEDECQAWIVIEHPLGAELDVSVRFNDPEGVILRHYPPTELLVNLVQGWNDACYVDDEATVEEALADVIEDVLAVYRFNADQTWDRYFPGRCEDDETLCNLDPVMPYDQLFILMAGSGMWVQDNISAGTPAGNKDERVDLAGASADDGVPAAWNSVCYAGTDQTAEEATSDISSAFEIMYTLGADQAWRRYIPDRPDIPDTLTTLHQFDSVILLVTAEGGVTWVFDS